MTGRAAARTRHLVVVDVETSGLYLHRHTVVEVAWWDLTTDHRGRFVPAHDWRAVVQRAELEALQINGYLARIAGTEQDDGSQARRLHANLTGHTFAGSNPAFDERFLESLFDSLGLEPRVWHHRLFDLSAYAAGVLGLPELPGLNRVCELLDVAPPDHTAEGDVTATGLCFRALQQIASRTRDAVTS